MKKEWADKFRKKTLAQFTTEIYKIVGVSSGQQRLYSLVDEKGGALDRRYYYSELQAVEKDNLILPSRVKSVLVGHVGGTAIKTRLKR